MMAMDVASGRPLWARALSSPVNPGVAPIFVGGGRITAFTDDTEANSDMTAVTVFDLATGAAEWTASSASAGMRGCAMAGDAYAGGLLYVEGRCGATATRPGVERVFGLDPGTGRRRVTMKPVMPCPSPLGAPEDPSIWSAAGHLVLSCTDIEASDAIM
jgi:hypothetical protein